MEELCKASNGMVPGMFKAPIWTSPPVTIVNMGLPYDEFRNQPHPIPLLWVFALMAPKQEQTTINTSIGHIQWLPIAYLGFHVLQNPVPRMLEESQRSHKRKHPTFRFLHVYAVFLTPLFWVFLGIGDAQKTSQEGSQHSSRFLRARSARSAFTWRKRRRMTMACTKIEILSLALKELLRSET